MAMIVEQRKPSMPDGFSDWKKWHEAPGSYVDDDAMIGKELCRLHEYCEYYGMNGWEFRVKQVKARKEAV